MSIDIRPAESNAELDAVYRFRYEVYVEEMGRRQHYADHEQRRIVDPLDDNCDQLYAAWQDGEVVGTVRSNFLRSNDIGEYYDYYRVGDLPDIESTGISITTRLMIHPRYRGGTLGMRLACRTYQDALPAGITTDFIDCNAHLVPYFTGLGYVRHRTDLVHPEYGPVTVMRLNLHDIDHFEAIRSPFRKYLRSYLQTNRAVAIEA